jgi:hypothetical protein
MQEQALFQPGLKTAIYLLRTKLSHVEWNGRYLRPFSWVLVISHFKLFGACREQMRLMELGDTAQPSTRCSVVSSTRFRFGAT